MVILRGGIYWVEFGGSRGAEIRKARPAVVVSNDAHNFYMSTVSVVPLTSGPVKIRPGEASIPAGIVGDGRACRAIVHQIGSVDRNRVRKKLGILPPEFMARVDAALRVHLELD
ncbi:MAG: type II toxin-antitoxin system PemK/MazF family toxin [Elusimicrobiota bacterium]